MISKLRGRWSTASFLLSKLDILTNSQITILKYLQTSININRSN